MDLDPIKVQWDELNITNKEVEKVSDFTKAFHERCLN
jgi:hypothetical protein